VDGGLDGVKCDSRWVIQGRDRACAEAGGTDDARRVLEPFPLPGLLLLFPLFHLLLLLLPLLLRASA
jgi:hypothetical protein